MVAALVAFRRVVANRIATATSTIKVNQNDRLIFSSLAQLGVSLPLSLLVRWKYANWMLSSAFAVPIIDDATERLQFHHIFCFSRVMSPTIPAVRGVQLDPQTRCAHYHGPTDIIAIKMKCCRIYYACKLCHDVLAGHDLDAWPDSEWNEKAILCGACGMQFTIRQYLQCEFCCSACRAQFNPACRNHYHYYFAMTPNRRRED